MTLGGGSMMQNGVPIPLRPDAVDMGKLHVVSVAAPIGEAIRRINNEESVSSLF